MEAAMESAAGLVLYRVNKGHSSHVAHVAAAMAGQSTHDWSAVYAQHTIEHAERYLPNRWNDSSCMTAELIELRVFVRDNAPQLQILRLLDDWMRDGTVSSAEKATRVRLALHERHGLEWLQHATREPLLQALGRHSCILQTWDTEDDLECVIPHELLALSIGTNGDQLSRPQEPNVIGSFQYRVLARYCRHPNYPITLRKEELHSDG
jgi:hypothetical protein